jgi:hypothetical protein
MVWALNLLAKIDVLRFLGLNLGDDHDRLRSSHFSGLRLGLLPVDTLSITRFGWGLKVAGWDKASRRGGASLSAGRIGFAIILMLQSGVRSPMNSLFSLSLSCVLIMVCVCFCRPRK